MEQSTETLTMNEINDVGRRRPQNFAENKNPNKRKKDEGADHDHREGLIQELQEQEWVLPPGESEAGKTVFTMLEEMSSELNSHPFYQSKSVRFVVSLQGEEKSIQIYAHYADKQKHISPLKLLNLWRLIKKETVTTIKGGLIDKQA